MNGLTDRFRRTIDYMRISVTDRCNLRCIYCMPPEGFPPMEHRKILRYEEIVRILRLQYNEIERLIRLSIEVKPEGHNIKIQDVYLKRLSDSERVCGRPMSKIGG